MKEHIEFKIPAKALRISCAALLFFGVATVASVGAQSVAPFVIMTCAVALTAAIWLFVSAVMD